jgi:hypothetical protein
MPPPLEITATPPRYALIGAVTFLASMGFILEHGWYAVVGIFLAYVGLLFFGGYRVLVADDGVVITTRFAHRRRFVPWSAVVAARRSARGVQLDLARGTLLLHAHRRDQPALLDRVNAALAVYQALAARDPDAVLARRGRDRETWLRAFSDTEGDFRSAPLGEDQLWHLVESPTAPPTARAAAALVLTRTAGDEARGRLRLAAEACASPRLRVVLDEAGSGAAEEALYAALDEVEDHERVALVSR